MEWGKSKVMTMAEAVRRFIRPGQVIQLGERGFPLGAPYALQNEVMRQFYQKEPQFTVVVYGGNANNLAPFIHGKMVKKVIACFMGDSYPHPSPNPVIQRAYAEGQIEFEEWTMLTLTLRLMAGAMGLPFIPTKSLVESSLAENNTNLQVISNPFADSEQGSSIGLVRSLNPDICLTHGWIADELGNTVIFPPYSGNVYGALGAKEGVIVSVERIVGTEELLRYRDHVRIPAAYVRAVVEAPFGSHPSGHFTIPGMGEGGYVEDRDFILQARRACRSIDVFDQWIETWILNCGSHEAYLRKLGYDRLVSLRGKAHPANWETERLCGNQQSAALEFTDEEKMIVAAARLIKKTVQEKGYHSIFGGIGAANLASWLAYYMLRDEGYPVSLLGECGMYGYEPLPGDAYLFAYRNLPTAQLYNDVFHTLGITVQGPQGNCLGVMGAAQIDRQGNINSSKIPQDSLYLMGAGGGNDVASGATELLIVVRQSKARCREKVDYVTSPGTKVKTLVTQLGMFEKGTDGKFTLAGYLEDPLLTEEKVVLKIQEECGWDFQVNNVLRVIPKASPQEISLLRQFDPERFFLGKA